ncbi:MAG: DNA translocase FtsK 4TM domain-containing protein, partial [Verrucomicrobiaceae bacterium]|nr:DNA translocase FtsK 4TM domain-containing protein [Verrucomicrobiaceae bacterium]
MNRAVAANAARPPRARSTDDKESPWNDVFGILLLMLAAMYLLALLSYDSRDMPAWSHLSHSDMPGTVTQNFMGIMGAVLAGYSLFFMGIAAYVVPVSITWFGVCKLHSKTRLTRIGWMGVGVLTVSAAALLQTLGLFEQNVEVTPAGGGGVVGRLIGDVLFMTLIGQVGSLLVLGTIYMVGL